MMGYRDSEFLVYPSDPAKPVKAIVVPSLWQLRLQDLPKSILKDLDRFYESYRILLF